MVQNVTFGALGVKDELVTALRDMGLVTPTPVQVQAIPSLLVGSDAIVQAQTGTGKTLAFVLPMLQRIDPEASYSQALIVTPTRELAIQIHSEIAKLAPALEIGALPVYGGQDVIAQAYRLQGGAHVIVGTPGRLNDHLRRGTIDLSRLAVLVLDEADQMLALGFLDEVMGVIEAAPVDRQTLLFSATMPEPVRRLAASYLREPVDIRVHGREITLDTIQQTLVETTDRAKQQTLLHLLRRFRPHLALIFCRTKIRAKKLTEALLEHGLNVDELHGDLTQARREDVMARFRSGEVQLLVATDVAARGLDVEGVTHVVNYDIPHDAESYIHRIGRTGRAGQRGFAFTLAAPKDGMYVEAIEKGIGTTLERQPDTVYRDGRDGSATAARGRDGRDRSMPKGERSGPSSHMERVSGSYVAELRRDAQRRKAAGGGQLRGGGRDSFGRKESGDGRDAEISGKVDRERANRGGRGGAAVVKSGDRRAGGIGGHEGGRSSGFGGTSPGSGSAGGHAGKQRRESGVPGEQGRATGHLGQPGRTAGRPNAGGLPGRSKPNSKPSARKGRRK